jgi:hypothetical protein
MLPSMITNVQNGFSDTPTASRLLLGESTAAAFATDRAFLHEQLRRQRLIDATMNSDRSSGKPHDDAAYMTAIANLRHQEAMLNLDRAIHEAEKRRYASIGYPSHLSSSFAGGLSGTTALPPSFSSQHPSLMAGIGHLARGLSGGSSTSFGSSLVGNNLHERTLLHSRLLEGSGSPLKGNFRDQVTLHPGALPIIDGPFYSSSLHALSRERLSGMDDILKSRSRSPGDTTDDNERTHPRR